MFYPFFNNFVSLKILFRSFLSLFSLILNFNLYIFFSIYIDILNIDYIAFLLGEGEPIHEHMSHTHVLQTIRRIVKDLANPRVRHTIDDDLANPNIDNTTDDDLANHNIDNTIKDDLANTYIDNTTDDDLANPNIDNSIEDLANPNINNTIEDMTNPRIIHTIDNMTNTNDTILASPNIIVDNDNLNGRDTIEEDANAEENPADLSSDLIIDENIKVRNSFKHRISR